MKSSSIPLKSLIRILLSLTTVILPCSMAKGQGSPAPTPAGIVMQRGWDSSVQEGDLTVEELNDELSRFGRAALNTGPAPDLDIYRGVKYLIPLKQALKVLRITSQVSAKHMVICPGLPYRTLVAYSFNYLEETGFNEIYIVADKADQVVAIQLSAAQGKDVPKHVWSGVKRY